MKADGNLVWKIEVVVHSSSDLHPLTPASQNWMGPSTYGPLDPSGVAVPGLLLATCLPQYALTAVLPHLSCSEQTSPRSSADSTQSPSFRNRIVELVSGLLQGR